MCRNFSKVNFLGSCYYKKPCEKVFIGFQAIYWLHALLVWMLFLEMTKSFHLNSFWYNGMMYPPRTPIIRINLPFSYTNLMCCLFFTTQNSLSLYILYDITSCDQDSKEPTSKKITTAVWNITSGKPEKHINEVSLTDFKGTNIT